MTSTISLMWPSSRRVTLGSDCVSTALRAKADQNQTTRWASRTCQNPWHLQVLGIRQRNSLRYSSYWFASINRRMLDSEAYKNLNWIKSDEPSQIKCTMFVCYLFDKSEKQACSFRIVVSPCGIQVLHQNAVKDWLHDVYTQDRIS